MFRGPGAHAAQTALPLAARSQAAGRTTGVPCAPRLWQSGRTFPLLDRRTSMCNTLAMPCP
eukprot:11171913-Lingulodinium_polyedra.AAC.1